jgi:hypothetical protein
MGNDKMREEFEAWYLASMVELLGQGVRSQAEKNLAWTRDDGSYADPTLRLGLMAWEASRAAVVVNLPIDVTGGLYRLAIEDCTRCVEAVGLRVKS